MKTEILAIKKSRSRAIIQCCLIAMVISLVIVAIEKISLNEFCNNILEWESI
jgi:hypothetical protein